MRMFNLNNKEDIEFVEYVMNFELNLGLDKTIFNSKKSLLKFFNGFSQVFENFGIVVDGDVVIFAD